MTVFVPLLASLLVYNVEGSFYPHMDPLVPSARAGTVKHSSSVHDRFGRSGPPCTGENKQKAL